MTKNEYLDEIVGLLDSALNELKSTDFSSLLDNIVEVIENYE